MKTIRKNLKYLFPLVIIVMIGGLILSRIYTPEVSLPEPDISIQAAEASQHIGIVAEVCGFVASARNISQIGGNPTFINFGKPNPNQEFTVVIWGEDRLKWTTPPEQMYESQDICAKGKIELHEGVPQIIVKYPDQIAIQR